MFNRYFITAIVLVLSIVFSYLIKFYFLLEYEISDKTEDWVNFSDYIGGLTTPILSFVSLVLLIKSLSLQNQTNKDLREELESNRKNEKIRSFETYFFGLIEAQRTSFASFKLNFPSYLGGNAFFGVCAIQKLEDLINCFMNKNWKINHIRRCIDKIDKDECIFNATRIFYNIVKMISERLDNKNGFDSEIRRNLFLTLINFTEFSQLRVVMISMQFMDWESANYLKGNKEFMEVLKSVGGGSDLY